MSEVEIETCGLGAESDIDPHYVCLHVESQPDHPVDRPACEIDLLQRIPHLAGVQSDHTAEPPQEREPQFDVRQGVDPVKEPVLGIATKGDAAADREEYLDRKIPAREPLHAEAGGQYRSGMEEHGIVLQPSGHTGEVHVAQAGVGYVLDLPLQNQTAARIGEYVPGIVAVGSEQRRVGGPGAADSRQQDQSGVYREVRVPDGLIPGPDLAHGPGREPATQRQAHLERFPRIILPVVEIGFVPRPEVAVVDPDVVVDQEVEGQRVDLSLAPVEIRFGEDEPVPPFPLDGIHSGAEKDEQVERLIPLQRIEQEELCAVSESYVGVVHQDRQRFENRSAQRCQSLWLPGDVPQHVVQAHLREYSVVIRRHHPVRFGIQHDAGF